MKMRRATLQSVILVATLSLVACSYHEDKHPLTSGIGQNNPTGPAVQKTTYKYIATTILARNCTGCHGVDKQKGGVRLDSYDEVMKCVNPNSAEGSLLMTKLTDESDIMPPRGKLPDDVIKQIADWIDQGAKNN